MENIGMGAGLGALGFWIFVAAAVIGGIWDGIRKRETQHETMRRLIDSNQPIDEALVDKLLALSEGSGKTSVRELKASLNLSGVLLLFLAPGLVFLGWLVGALLPLVGVSGLMVFLGLGLLVAARFVDRWYGENGEAAPIQPRS